MSLPFHCSEHQPDLGPYYLLVVPLLFFLPLAPLSDLACLWPTSLNTILVRPLPWAPRALTEAQTSQADSRGSLPP